MLHMLILSHGKRLEALKKREKYITQEEIDKRDDVLSVDYDQYDYDLVILNDHREATVEEAIRRIEEGLERPTLRMDMHLGEFEPKAEEIIAGQNKKLGETDKSKIVAYTLLISYRKIKNTLELNGSFKKELASNKTPEEIEKYARKCRAELDKLLGETQKLFGENVDESNLHETLLAESQDVLRIVQNCKEELKQTAQDTNLTISSSIYVAPEQLKDGKLQTSKDVLNVAGEIGDWVFAQSDTLVDNPYLLRKSGKGVLARGEICIPGDTSLLVAKDARAILTDPVYVYLMKTNQFEPVVTVDYMPNGEPAIRFEGEWTSDRDIARESVRVKRYTDVTEMLDYLQLFSVADKETYSTIANLPNDLQEAEREGVIREYVANGKLCYINNECGVNVRKQLLPVSKTISRSDVVALAKQPAVQMEKENAKQIAGELNQTKEKGVQNNVRS